jgi:hypothetical protein
MPDDALINRVNDALFLEIEAAWTEVVVQNGKENGVWFTEDVKSIPFAQLKAPYAVVQTGEYAPQTDYGPVYSTDMATYLIHYVRAQGVTDRVLRLKVKALVNQLRSLAHDLYHRVASADGVAQTYQVSGPVTGDVLPLNKEFLDRELRTRAAALTLRVLTREPYAR